MSYSWAGRRSGVPPNSSSQQKKVHVREIMPFSNRRPVLWSRRGVCIIRPACRTIFHTQEGSMVETYLPGGAGGLLQRRWAEEEGRPEKQRNLPVMHFSSYILFWASKSLPDFFSPPQFSAVDDAAQKAAGNLITLRPLSYCTLFFLGRVKDPFRCVPEFEVNASRFRSRPQELSVSFPRMTVARRLLNANASSQSLFKHQRFSCSPKKEKKIGDDRLSPPRCTQLLHCSFFFLT